MLMDLSGYTIQLLLRVPFSDVDPGFWLWLQTRCTHYFVGEHPADQEVKNTHCHVAIYEPCGAEGLRKALKRYELGGKKYSILTVCQNTKVPYNFWKLMVYILKGDSLKFRRTDMYIFPDEKPTLVGWIQGQWINYGEEPDEAVLTDIVDLSGQVIDKKFIRKEKKEKVHDDNSKYAIVQEVVAVMGNQHYDHDTLIKAVRNALVKRHQVLGMYKVMDLIDSVLMYSKSHQAKWLSAVGAMMQKRYAY